jgi:DNA-binding beta-propeller fold protein YncE
MMGRPLFAMAAAMGLGLLVTPPAPTFVVDKLWPMPLPNHWVLGSVTGVAVDRHDHVWIAHRAASLNLRTEIGLAATPPTAEDCCLPAPPILQFDAAGKLLGSWGGPGQGYDWPVSVGGITIDDRDNVWVTAAGVPEPAAAAAGAMGVVPGRGAAGRGAAASAPTTEPPLDAQLLVFSADGQFVRQIGKPGQTSADNDANLDRPAAVAVDTKANEVYVADGGTHQRIVVLDATTGAFKRQWSGHGTPFARLSAIALAKDGLVYVGDRKNNRVQVFQTDGQFVNETSIAPHTLGNGSVWGVALSSDSRQQYLLVADGQNEQVVVLVRATLAPVTTFGDGGRWPGRFYAVDAVAVDSRGNVYTGEGYEGKRVQKFLKQ